MRTNEFSVDGKRVVVAGAARSGVAAAELLARRGARVILSDIRESVDAPDRLREQGIELELGGHRPETFETADLIVLSPGVPPRQPVIERARRSGVPAIGEVELAARWLRGRIVAVTGTKGKSTTTVLTGRMLGAGGQQALVGGNLGTALSSQVEQSTPDLIHVVEVSSFQLELTETFRPWIAVFLNLSADHLDRHADFAEYAGAKARILANQTSQDTMVINADDPQVLELARRGRARRLRYGLDRSMTDGVVIADGVIAHRTADGDEPLVPLSAVRLPGSHLLSDVMAASAVGFVAGVPTSAMERAVASFDGLPHALEHVGEHHRVAFVDDSKATNVMAARAAIESFSSGLVVILGGRYKGGELSELGPVLTSRADAVVAIGEARDRIHAALDSLIAVHDAESLEDAVRRAFGLARPGGTVLLAPACASLDMFESYAARGDAFKKEVARIADSAE